MCETRAVDCRAQDLYDRLTEVSARALSEVRGPGDSRLEFWELGEIVVVIQFYSEGTWQMYAPINPVSGVDEASAALQAISRLQ